jgi:hypothetical protein
VVIGVVPSVDVVEVATLDVGGVVVGEATLEATVLAVATVPAPSVDPLVHPTIVTSRTATLTARTPIVSAYVVRATAREGDKSRRAEPGTVALPLVDRIGTVLPQPGTRL